MVNNSAGSFKIIGSGSISGNTGLTKNGTQTLILGTSNSYTGATVVNAGKLELSIAGALPAGNALTIAAGAQVVADTDIGVLILSSLNLNANGKLDLTDNGLIVHKGDLTALTDDVKAGDNILGWNGSTGITSSTAAADTRSLSALGVIQNETAGDGIMYSTTFDGTTGLSLATSDVLIRYTFYGDANLDGTVDGSDYSLIDNGFLDNLSGWQNGDFNYDHAVDGSDYTLIDNAFNNQGANLAAFIASPAAASASTVPEPAAFGLVAISGLGLLGRRRK
jgi:autotransporter-associated beta strand protein